MPGVEMAGLITALFVGVGGLITAIVSARSSSKKSDLDALKDVIGTLQSQVDNQARLIGNLQTENNALHDTDNSLKAENLQQRKELEAVREENRILRTQVEKQAAEIIVLRDENTALKTQLDAYRRPPAKKQTGPLGET